jgi:hypothetical protein
MVVSILHFSISIFHHSSLAACEPKTTSGLAGGLTTEGHADRRMKTFAAGGFEIKTVELSARKLDYCVRTRAVGQGSGRGLFIRSSALLSAGMTKPSHFAGLPLRSLGGSGHLVARQIRRSVFSDEPRSDFSKSGSRFPDNSFEHLLKRSFKSSVLAT